MKRKAPTASQGRFHSAACAGGCIVPGCEAPPALHHCAGASARHNKIAIGQWWVLPLCDGHHQYGPVALHPSPLAFAALVKAHSRKQAEKLLFSALLERLSSEGRDGLVPVPVILAIEGYTR